MSKHRLAIAITKIEFFHDLKFLSIDLITLLASCWCNLGWWSRIAKEV